MFNTEVKIFQTILVKPVRSQHNTDVSKFRMAAIVISIVVSISNFEYQNLFTLKS